MSKLIEELNMTSPGTPDWARIILKQKVVTNYNNLSKSVVLLSSIKSFHMNMETKEYYENNVATIYANYDKAKESYNEFVNPAYLSSSGTERQSSVNDSIEGCYIATMAYGDYDHPQVIELRKFRDDVLSKSFLGRVFIKVYYKTSPFMVRNLKDKEVINITIKKLLDNFIYIITKK